MAHFSTGADNGSPQSDGEKNNRMIDEGLSADGSYTAPAREYIHGVYAPIVVPARVATCLEPYAGEAAIAHEYLESKRDVQALQATETAERANRRNELTKSLFGSEGFTTAQDAIFYRDAQDRADSIPRYRFTGRCVLVRQTLKDCLGSP